MLQNCSIFKVAKVFFDEPVKGHYLMEISEKSEMAHTSVKKYLEELKEMNIISESSEKKGKRIFPLYKANIENERYRFYKKINNLECLNESGLLKFLKDKLMPKTLVLFGSYSRGEDIEDSDIDLFLACEKEELDLSRFENILNRKIQIQFKEKFEDYPRELKNNIANGMVLLGYLEAF